MGDRIAAGLFDDWAETYDDDVREPSDRYPFAGYDAVLDAVMREALRVDPRRVLDLGCGTGTLLARLVRERPGIEPWGIDLSARMLERARTKVPTGRFFQADLSGDLSSLHLPSVQAIVSTYTLHELPDERKARLIRQLRTGHLAPDGVIALGDIAFRTDMDRDAVRATTPEWDDAEHYLVAERFLPRLAALGIPAAYRQLSVCAGLLVVAAAVQRDRSAGFRLAGAPPG